MSKPAPALSLLLLLSLPAALPPAAPAGAREARNGDELFIERVDINVINVEAFVSDRDGKAVDDLKLEDFEVFEDGKPVEISNFFHSQASPLADRLERDRRRIAADGAAGVPAPRELPEDQRLNLVVYIDLFNMRPSHRTRVLKELGGFLEDRLYQGDRIMSIAHQQNLQMIHPFTQDLRRVIQGIEQVAGMATHGQTMDAERRRAKHALVQVTDDSGGDQVNAFETIRLFVQQQRLETEKSMRDLETVLRSLGGLPGRRALLYVSDGLEKQPASDLFHLYTQRYGAGNRLEGSFVQNRSGLEVLRHDLTDVFRQVAAAANTHQVTLHTLNGRGSTGLQDAGMDERDPLIGMGGMAASNSERIGAEQEPLIDLADETGGSAILDTANFGGALAALSRDFDSLYSLGYRSRGGGDGRYHKIEVKVKRPGLTVRHRAGYVDQPQDRRVADRAFSSLILELESNPLGVAVAFAPPTRESRGNYHLPLLVKIPLRELTLLPDGTKVKGKLRLYFAVQDPDGAISEVQEIPYPVEIPAADAEAVKDKDIGYALKLAVREGTPKVAITVWDEISGLESYLLRSVPVGKAAQKKAAN